MLDVIRGRVLLRIGETFDRKLSGRVHEAIVRLPLEARMPGDGLQPLRDLDNVRGFLSGQGPTALFDLPWMPLYLGICFLFHFWIGITALVGAIVLVSLTVITDALSRGPTRAAMQHGMERNALMEAGRRNAEAVRAMGLGGRVAERWQKANTDYLAANRRTGDIAGGLGGVVQIAADDPAIGHAGGRRLSGHQAGDERWRHDREFDHDGPRAGAGRSRDCQLETFPDGAAELGPAQGTVRADA